MERTTFQPGEVVVLRNVLRGEVRWAATMRVVEDSGDFVALFLDIGTHYRVIADAAGAHTRDFVHSVGTTELIWEQHRALQLIRFGDWHATIPMWREDGEFVGWYINFQEPLRRSNDGFVTMDLSLDMLIWPDGQRWSWKDEDEFADGIAAGWYTEELLTDLKRRGLEIAEAARRGDPPFGDHWPRWKPDLSWAVPEPPTDWNVV